MVPRWQSAPGLLLALALPALPACNQDLAQAPPPGGGTALVAGGSLPVSAGQATALVGEGGCAADGLGHAAWAAVVASGRADVCGSWQAGQAVPGLRAVQLLLVDPAAGGALPGAGRYAVGLDPPPTGRGARVEVRQADGACAVVAEPASAGAVDLTTATADLLAGTVTAYLADGGTIAGDFWAVPCTAAAAADLCAGTAAPATSRCGP